MASGLCLPGRARTHFPKKMKDFVLNGFRALPSGPCPNPFSEKDEGLRFEWLPGFAFRAVPGPISRKR
jgi:hypothetical protein